VEWRDFVRGRKGQTTAYVKGIKASKGVKH
jgi:hypothetical protein